MPDEDPDQPSNLLPVVLFVLVVIAVLVGLCLVQLMDIADSLSV